MQTHVLRIRDLANTAGLITGTRLLIALAFPFLTAHPRVALAAYLFASLTDVLDGAVARRTNTASHTGAFVDGWVDKILHINGAWSMTLHGYMPAWWMWLWFSRELILWAMVMIFMADFRHGRVQPHTTTTWGRMTAATLFGAMVLTLMGHPTLAWPLTAVTGLVGAVAGGVYFRRHLVQRRLFD